MISDRLWAERPGARVRIAAAKEVMVPGPDKEPLPRRAACPSVSKTPGARPDRHEGASTPGTRRSKACSLELGPAGGHVRSRLHRGHLSCVPLSKSGAHDPQTPAGSVMRQRGGFWVVGPRFTSPSLNPYELEARAEPVYRDS